ncbi:hypothetical protein CVT26_012711 [Gymnopilus dilepis]|uniref:Uncharacterized protein n=1 Tax=Gymnopilus dilepis TaxID=231916 RepID=A0A409YPG8_9AGAR|nr:hypothetical protein CVT26_012711 [Gymnopilus dilepis]
MSREKDHSKSPRFAADTNFEGPSTAESHSFPAPGPVGGPVGSETGSSTGKDKHLGGGSSRIQEPSKPKHSSEETHSSKGVLDTLETTFMGAVHGAEHVIHDLEEQAKAHMHLPGRHSARQGSSEDKVVSDEKGREASPVSDHETSAVTPGKPVIIKRRPSNSPEYDMYGDPVNYRQWIFEEDLSVESLDLAARTQCEQAFARGRASKALPRRSATLDILPTEGRAPDIYVHHAATDIHRTDSREKNMLPAHSTPKATSSDNDADECHSVDTDSEPESVPTQCSASCSVRAVRGSEVPSVASSSDTDLSLSGRFVEEIRERPVFEGGQTTAAGKYEAVFEPIIEPESQTDTGKFLKTEGLNSIPMGEEGVATRTMAGSTTIKDRDTRDEEIAREKCAGNVAVESKVGFVPLNLRQVLILHQKSEAELLKKLAIN